MMRFMRILAGLVGLALLAGELARRGESVLAQPNPKSATVPQLSMSEWTPSTVNPVPHRLNERTDSVTASARLALMAAAMREEAAMPAREPTDSDSKSNATSAVDACSMSRTAGIRLNQAAPATPTTVNIAVTAYCQVRAEVSVPLRGGRDDRRISAPETHPTLQIDYLSIVDI